MNGRSRFSTSALSRIAGVGAALMSLAAPFIGIAYLVSEHREIVEERSLELTALGRLRIGQVQTWFDERMQDAQFVHRSEAIAAQADGLRRHARTLQRPDWLQSMFRNGQYRSIQIYSPDGRLLSSAPEQDLHGHHDAELMRRALSARAILFDDLRQLDDGGLRMHLYVPLLGTSSGTDAEPAGVVIFDIDPSDRLFPVVRAWPVPSTTAQSLLYRVVGDSVEYLDPDLRPDMEPLSFRLSLAQPDLPAARGGRGYQGIVDGVDYRGNAVLAYVASVPGTPWLMVSKIDRSEILEQWSEERLIVGVASIFAMLFAASVILMMRRLAAQQLGEERTRHRSDLEAIRHHQSEIVDLANDIVILSDGEDRILQVNQMAASVYGGQDGQLIGRTVASLRADGDSESYRQSFARLRRRGQLRYSAVHRAADGRTFDVDVAARHLFIDSRVYIQRIVRDVTERVAYESELRRLNRTRRILSAVNRLITREQDEERLLAGVCSIAVTEGALPLVWIGRTNSGSTEVAPVTASGEAAPHAATIRIPLTSSPTSLALDGRPLLSGSSLVIDDLEQDVRARPWREEARRYGLRSSAVVPIMTEGHLWGVISFSAPEPSFFAREEMDLFEEIAADIAFALTSMRAQRERRHAEAMLAEQQTTYRAMFENSGEAILLTRPEGTFISMNPEALRMFGRTEEEVPFLTRDDLVDLTDPRLAVALEERRRTGRFCGELRLKRSDGTIFPGEVSTVIFDVSNGEQRTTMTIRDVSERRASEKIVQSQLAELRRWHDLTLERETRVMDLKREVNALLRERNAPERYPSIGADGDRGPVASHTSTADNGGLMPSERIGR